MGKIEEIQGHITQFRLTDFAHSQTWTVFPRDLPISKVWNRSDNICLSYLCKTSKMGKIEEIQGQITQFWLTDFAHTRTWPVFSRDLPISKVWNRLDKIWSSYRCNTKIVYDGRTTDNLPWHKLFGLWPVELKKCVLSGGGRYLFWDF